MEETTAKMKSMMKTDNAKDRIKEQETLKGNTLSDRIDSLEMMARSTMQTLVRNRSDSREADKGENRAVRGVFNPRYWNKVTHKMMNTLRSNSAELYDIQFEDEKTKQNINPFALRDEIKNIIRRKPKQINPSRNGYIVRVESEEERGRLSGLQMMSGKKCSVRRHRLFNQAKGSIYVYE